MIAVVDYGLGNIGSITNALSKIRIKAKLADCPEDIKSCSAVIFPGDGAAGWAMENLKKRELIRPLKDHIFSGKPFLGICLGMQVLFSFSEEGNVNCLDIIKGDVIKFTGELKIPQIGWNKVQVKSQKAKVKRLFENVPDNSFFYFINSYYCRPADKKIIIAESEYGQKFCSIFLKDNIVGVQFHPEKSGKIGLILLKNFYRFAYAYYSGS